MRALRLILPLALIGICLALAGGRETLQRLSALSPGWVVITLALLNGVTLLSALRWRRTAEALDLGMPRGEVVREYYMAQFVNQTLPGGVLGDAARAVRSRQGGPMNRAAQAVVLERAAGQAGMAAIGLLGLVAFFAEGGTAAPGRSWGIWLAGAALVALLVGLALRASRRGRADGWRAAARMALWDQLPAQAALSLLIAALTVAAFVTAARASGSVLTIGMAALIVPLALTAMLLPASVAGWGWREGAAAALFPLAGLGPEAGLAASIAFGIAGLIAALPGAFFLRRTAHAVSPPVTRIASHRE